MQTLQSKDNHIDPFKDPTILAISIILDRIRRLCPQDRDDLFDLFKAYSVALANGDDEAAASAVRGWTEILEETGGQTSEVVLKDSDKSHDKWLTYVSGRIKELRKQAGLTQEQLAELTGLPQPHISRLENKDHSPSHVTLQKIANALGVPVSDLDPSLSQGD